MSKLYKRGRIWYITYQKQEGNTTRQIRQSLGTDSKKVARLLQAKIDLDNLLGEGPSRTASISLAAFQKKYLEYRAVTVRHNTYLTDRAAFRLFVEALGDSVLLSEITSGDIDRWEAYVLQDRAKTTLKIYRKHLSAAFETARRWKLVQFNVFPLLSKII